MKSKPLLILLIFFNAVSALMIAPTPKRYVFMDVGQGDAALSQSGSHIYLVDTGPEGGIVRKIGEYLGRRKYLDVVFISHYDKDHSGGALEIAKRYEIGALVFPSADGKTYPDTTSMPYELFEAMNIARARGTRVTAVTSGTKIDFGEEQLEILSPDIRMKLKGDNDNSIVIFAIAKPKRILFAADISQKAEEKLMRKYGKLLRADILKVAHHGAKSSTGDRLLKYVRPELAIISVGKNFYGHPAKETLQRLILAGAKIRRTDYEGDIQLEK